MSEDIDVTHLAIQIAELRADVAELATAQADQTAATADLVSAWRTATGLVVFIKWLSGLVAALLVLKAVTGAGAASFWHHLVNK